MRILWDEPKRLDNFAKHGLDFADLDLGFFLEGHARQTRFGRIKVVGRFREQAIAVVIKPLGREAISIISMRRASRAERRQL
jgi:uncharacterized DUF497 family protein